MLGATGNSGNSDGPHLHFHVTEALNADTAPLRSEGVPFLLDVFSVVSHDPESVSHGDRLTKLGSHQAALPVEGDVIRIGTDARGILTLYRPWLGCADIARNAPTPIGLTAPELRASNLPSRLLPCRQEPRLRPDVMDRNDRSAGGDVVNDEIVAAFDSRCRCDAQSGRGECSTIAE